MGCFEAVVAPHPLLEADGGDDCVRLRQGDDEWDEAPCNIYELLCSASVGTRCEGIRCSQFASGPQQHAFRRKCQHAVDEKHRLDHDQRELAVLMGGAIPAD